MKPPKTFQEFVQRYPKIGQAWDLLTEAGQKGPLNERTVRLVKLAIAIGSLREGAVHAGVRKALMAGCTAEDIEQVVTLASSTIGLPSTVAVYSWCQEQIKNAESGQSSTKE